MTVLKVVAMVEGRAGMRKLRHWERLRLLNGGVGAGCSLDSGLLTVITFYFRV